MKFTNCKKLSIYYTLFTLFQQSHFLFDYLFDFLFDLIVVLLFGSWRFYYLPY